MRLFICALWSPARKGLASWLSFVVSNCEFVTFTLVSWVRCGTCLYRFLMVGPYLHKLSLLPFADLSVGWSAVCDCDIFPDITHYFVVYVDKSK